MSVLYPAKLKCVQQYPGNPNNRHSNPTSTFMNFFEAHLRVKTSTLPGAGKGLFTKKAIPKGTIITEYTGKVSKWKDAEHEDGTNPYIYYVTRNYVIDGKGPEASIAKYANDARGFKNVKGYTNNAGYLQKGKRVFVEALRDITAGEEIFVAYGKEYWDVMKENKRIEAAAKK